MVQGVQGQVGLETEPPAVSPDQSLVGPFGHRSLCDAPVNSSQQVLQLEARSAGSSGGCLHPVLEGAQGICQSTLEHDTQVYCEGETRSGNDCHDNPSLEIAAMVSPHCRYVHRLPEAASSAQGHRATHRELTGAQAQDRAGRMAHFRTTSAGLGLSQEVTSLLGASWRDGTHKNYNSAWGKWEEWCISAKIPPLAATLNDILSFLTAQFKAGHSYHSINVYRSALSSLHPRIDGYTIGSHPLVVRLLKGIFNKRPPHPKYATTWPVGIVLSFLKELGDNMDLSLKNLTYKLVMLLALSTAARSSDLVLLSTELISFVTEGVRCQLSGLSKQSRPGHVRSALEITFYQEDTSICPVDCLKTYLRKTQGLRGRSKQLFIGLVKPHKPVKACTIARWIKTTLTSAGIDKQFTAHSTRGAASSSAVAGGASIQEVMQQADWSSARTFHKHYFRPRPFSKFSSAVLASNLHI